MNLRELSRLVGADGLLRLPTRSRLSIRNQSLRNAGAVSFYTSQLFRGPTFLDRAQALSGPQPPEVQVLVQATQRGEENYRRWMREILDQPPEIAACETCSRLDEVIEQLYLDTDWAIRGEAFGRGTRLLVGDGPRVRSQLIVETTGNSTIVHSASDVRILEQLIHSLLATSDTHFLTTTGSLDDTDDIGAAGDATYVMDEARLDHVSWYSRELGWLRTSLYAGVAAAFLKSVVPGGSVDTLEPRAFDPCVDAVKAVRIFWLDHLNFRSYHPISAILAAAVVASHEVGHIADHQSPDSRSDLYDFVAEQWPTLLELWGVPEEVVAGRFAMMTPDRWTELVASNAIEAEFSADFAVTLILGNMVGEGLRDGAPPSTLTSLDIGALALAAVGASAAFSTARQVGRCYQASASVTEICRSSVEALALGYARCSSAYALLSELTSNVAAFTDDMVQLGTTWFIDSLLPLAQTISETSAGVADAGQIREVLATYDSLLKCEEMSA